MRFDDLGPGAVLGTVEYNLDRETVAHWRTLFPGAAAEADDQQIPAGFVAVVAMRAYTQACGARPPGNIHGEQVYEILRLPEIGSTVVTQVSCIAKEIKGGRRWLTFATTTQSADGKALFRGEMKIAWSQ